MNKLEEFYNIFYKSSKQKYLRDEVEKYHQELIETLSKEDRKKVLRVMDNLDMIAELHKLESFVCGFKLASEITKSIENYVPEEFIV